MKGSNKELWLFTSRFPFGNSEPFLENELPFLAQGFQKVRVFPLFTDEGQRHLPPNVEVVQAIKDPYAAAGPNRIIKHWRTWRKMKRSIFHHAPDRAKVRARWPELRSQMRQHLHRAEVLRAGPFSAFDPARHVLYSYWTADWATTLGVLGEWDDRLRFVSRVHGFDLFEDRNELGTLPFRAFQLPHIDRIFAVSQAGLDHLRTRHPGAIDRFELARLGTIDHGPGPFTPGEQLHLVSCSNLVPLKRVELIAEALGSVRKPTLWTHFGDGPMMKDVQLKVAHLPEHVKVNLKGNVPNQEILRWYKDHSVDVFVHVSSTEGGVPVALQEAASFGIPLLAADAGGVNEIVNDRTGILLPQDLKPGDLASILDGLHGSSMRDPSFRSGVRTHWKAHFQAPVNFGQFCERLLGR